MNPFAYYIVFCYVAAAFMCLVGRNEMADDEVAWTLLLAPVMITFMIIMGFYMCLGSAYDSFARMIHNGSLRWRLRQDDLRDPGGE